MSYIKQVLEGYHPTRITEFLLNEGFEYGTGAMGEGKMRYVASGAYTVWLALCEEHFSLYAEYNCGGCVGEQNVYFEKDNFEHFMESYKRAVEWTNNYI